MFGSTIFGLITALAWGSADFVARYTSRALGHQNAVLGMLLSSGILLSLVIWLTDVPLVYDPGGLWLLLLSGVGFMLGTLFLYAGLARGPVTVVAPIVGGYPAFNLLFAVATGVRPGAAQWFAMATIMIGVVMVARYARLQQPFSPVQGGITKTVLIALLSALAFAGTIAAGQGAIPIYGELQTVWAVRWISITAMVPVFLLARKQPVLPVRWWPLLTFQGILDAGAYLALLLGSHGIGAQITVVIGSGFCAVTVILARVFLREAMSLPQWLGVVLIVAGVVQLAAQ